MDELITVLKEKQWEYSLNENGVFSMILGNEEISCCDYEHEKIQLIIQKVREW